ncbi:MAG: FCD domain-containing protein [Acidimicrobiia bacterium]|nr:FCD domain-containing protein [Acidimicrobiia bacterium]
MELSTYKDDRQTAQGYVRNSIRSAIFSGDLSAGDRLVQAEIARQLNVSTTPVREALRELATEGLLTLDAHHGALVRDLDHVELKEIHDVRQLLEPEVMRRAIPRLTPDQIDKASDLQKQMAEDVNIATWAELNRQFHRVFLDACGSNVLADLVSNLQDRYAAHIVSSMDADPRCRLESNREHEALVVAAKQRDIPAATHTILIHIAAPLGSS